MTLIVPTPKLIRGGLEVILLVEAVFDDSQLELNQVTINNRVTNFQIKKNNKGIFLIFRTSEVKNSDFIDVRFTIPAGKKSNPKSHGLKVSNVYVRSSLSPLSKEFPFSNFDALAYAKSNPNALLKVESGESFSLLDCYISDNSSILYIHGGYPIGGRQKEVLS